MVRGEIPRYAIVPTSAHQLVRLQA
jgi:hypothetical protein